jgi:hypothetical protein
MTQIDIDPKTRKAIRDSAKGFATSLINHPMLTMMVTRAMTTSQIPVTEDNKEFYLDEVVRTLNRMFFGQ